MCRLPAYRVYKHRKVDRTHILFYFDIKSTPHEQKLLSERVGAVAPVRVLLKGAPGTSRDKWKAHTYILSLQLFPKL